MSYEEVLIYSKTGAFVGWGIKGSEIDKLQSANLWTEAEQEKLAKRLNELNENVDLNATWPHPQDPDVLQLLADKNFVPIEYEERQVVDDDHSDYVWEQVPETDDNGVPTGRFVDGENIDRQASVIRYKMDWLPKRPSDVMWRIKKASEVVARKRAGL